MSYTCGSCGAELYFRQTPCIQCGRAIEWSGLPVPPPSGTPVDSKPVIMSFEERVAEVEKLFGSIGRTTTLISIDTNTKNAVLQVSDTQKGQIGMDAFSILFVIDESPGGELMLCSYSFFLAIKSISTYGRQYMSMCEKLQEENDSKTRLNNLTWMILPSPEIGGITIKGMSEFYTSFSEVADSFLYAEKQAILVLQGIENKASPVLSRIFMSFFLPLASLAVCFFVFQLPNDWFFLLLKGALGVYTISTSIAALRYMVTGRLDR